MCAPRLPGHLQAAALVVTRLADQANAGWLDNLADAVGARVADGALGKEAAAPALFARVDEPADPRHRLSVGILDGKDAARAVDARLRGFQLRRVKGGVLVPNDRGHLGCGEVLVLTWT